MLFRTSSALSIALLLIQLSGCKNGTLPKLELLALLVATELSGNIRKELHIFIERIRIFSDSRIALTQIHSGKNSGTFVNNRVRKIRAMFASWQEHNLDLLLY